MLVFGLRPNASGVSSQALVDDAIDSPTAGFAVLGGFRALAADSDARLVVAVLSARQLMIGVTDVLFVLLAIEVFGTGESGAAVMSAAIGAGGILGGALAFGLIGRHRIAPVLVASGALFGATFAAIGVLGRRLRADAAGHRRHRARADGRRRAHDPPARRPRRGPGAASSGSSRG